MVGVQEGPALISTSEPFDTRDNSVVVSVRVVQVFKDEESLVRDDLVHVSLPRGVGALDEDGQVLPNDAAPSLAEVRESLRAGLEVVVIARPRDDAEHVASPSVIREEWHGQLPTDAILLGGMHPQSFVVDQGDEPLHSWPGLTFADLVEQLRQ
ncbi:hypothetical protein [Nocardioides alcanivorans]|uniref:hypothetical protein n=1 Tax=Nocardioides alcanivorans TaxID=2897352 RepID=UPI001F30859C|nr:hypothetical protein [Nocardioides alcanivorans]